MGIQDEPEWHKAETDESEAEGEGELYEFGQECLDRLALAVGGNALAPLAAPALGRLLISPDWRSRHAALICLAQIAEGCAKVLLKQLKGLADMCMKVRCSLGVGHDCQQVVCRGLMGCDVILLACV